MSRLQEISEEQQQTQQLVRQPLQEVQQRHSRKMKVQFQTEPLILGKDSPYHQQMSCNYQQSNQDKHEQDNNKEDDPSLQNFAQSHNATVFQSPYFVQKTLQCLLHKWGNMVQAIHPFEFMKNMTSSRGYTLNLVPSLVGMGRSPPTEKQMNDYDNELVWSVRQGNLEHLQQLYNAGRSMNACNKYSESVVHMACRRADFRIIEFLLTHGGSAMIVDDYGRTPLHDACWRTEPAFDIVTLLLDQNKDLLCVTDARGALPLKYVVSEKHWLPWCAYLFHQRDKYWPKRPI